MYLRNRGAGDRDQVKVGKGILIGAAGIVAIDAIKCADHLVCTERRHRILQRGQTGSDIGRNQIWPGRKQLSELDENRPQFFERLA